MSNQAPLNLTRAVRSIKLGLSALLFAVGAVSVAAAEDADCVACHEFVHPGITKDWQASRHAEVNVSCIDCHRVDKDSPMATQHASLIGTDVFVSVLVAPSTCGTCHAEAVAQFNASGHFRSYHQIIPKDNLHALVRVHEGQGIPDLDTASDETGCMQCHGTKIELMEDGRPTPETWPNAGMGNIYPDGSTGNCSACHTRHRFSLAESRKPAASSSQKNGCSRVVSWGRRSPWRLQRHSRRYAATR